MIGGYRLLATCMLMLACAQTLGWAAPSVEQALGSTKATMLYVVSPHPEDEIDAWPLVQRRAPQYTVFVTLTQGEQTVSCMTAAEASESGLPDAAGPYRYQGVDSPVGEPDLGERHPLGNPWQGRGTQACKDARIQSWHWFLDDMARLDPSLPVDPPEVGAYCTPAVGCVTTWASDLGARVAFDLGDGSLTTERVIAALATLRENRAAWGLPTIPESGVVTGYYNEVEYGRWQSLNDGSAGVLQFAVANCAVYTHPDQRAVSEAIRTHDFGAGQQLGATAACGDDVALVASMDAASLAAAYLLEVHNYALTGADDERRYGAYVVNYGWQFPTWSVGPINQAYWRATF